MAAEEKSSCVVWEGIKVPMQLAPNGWRARKRSRHLTVDYSTNIMSLRAAQKAVKDHLDEEKEKANRPRGTKTLEDVVKVYQSLPKKARLAAEKISISRLRGCVRLVMKKELKKVPATAINAKFWLDYVAIRQGAQVADLGSRSQQNQAINSAMRSAAAVFKDELRPLYAEKGIVFAPDVTTIQWLKKIKIRKPEANVEDMEKAWAALRGKDDAMWLAIGLARFAGLRRDELENVTKAWVETDGEATYIRLRDRHDEAGRWEGKTGEEYRSLIINADVAEAARQAEPGFLINPNLKPPIGRPMKRPFWFEHHPQKWLKPFVGAVRKPLHRMRDLYAIQLAKLTEDAVKARLAGIKAASEALGHTTTKTTEDHYLPPD